MSQPAMDAGAFAELKEMMGDAFKDIIAMCLQSLPQQLSEIEAAITDDNADLLFNVAHKMKSSCGSIGAFGLAAKAEAIEIVGRNGSTDVSALAYQELCDAAQMVIDLLNSEIDDTAT